MYYPPSALPSHVTLPLRVSSGRSVARGWLSLPDRARRVLHWIPLTVCCCMTIRSRAGRLSPVGFGCTWKKRTVHKAPDAPVQQALASVQKPVHKDLAPVLLPVLLEFVVRFHRQQVTSQMNPTLPNGMSFCWGGRFEKPHCKQSPTVLRTSLVWTLVKRRKKQRSRKIQRLRSSSHVKKAGRHVIKRNCFGTLACEFK